MHHDEAVAVYDGILHVVGDHHGSQVVIGNDLVGNLKHFGGCLRIERCGVLVSKQKPRFLDGGHEQCDRLALTAGQQPYFAGKPVLQTEI